MLRKFSIVTLVLSTTISVMGYLFRESVYFGDIYYYKSTFQKLIDIHGNLVASPDWFPIFFVSLAIASLVGIFIFKEDSKSDSQPK